MMYHVVINITFRDFKGFRFKFHLAIFTRIDQLYISWYIYWLNFDLRFSLHNIWSTENYHYLIKLSSSDILDLDWLQYILLLSSLSLKYWTGSSLLNSDQLMRTDAFSIVGWILWHINLCRLFNVKFCSYVYTFNLRFLNEYWIDKNFR